MAKPPYRKWWHQCMFCGTWLTGPFARRHVEEVPHEDMSQQMLQVFGQEARGHYVETPYRPGGKAYQHAEGEYVGGAACEHCARRYDREEVQPRLARLRRERVMAAPDEGNEGEGGNEAG